MVKCYGGEASVENIARLAVISDAPTVADKALKGIDVRVYPYPVTKEMIVTAIGEIESYNDSHK